MTKCLLVALALAGLSACGNKGDLYLPDVPPPPLPGADAETTADPSTKRADDVDQS